MAAFKPALIIVDYQYDFCPPDGALAVPDALSLLPILNTLLSHPFALKIATRDAHPIGHISFASTHQPPNNIPGVSKATVANPSNPNEKAEIALWPNHCVSGTHGAELVKGLDAHLLDGVVDKGTDVNVEMLSAFQSSFRDPATGETGLAEWLRREHISHVFVAGLAADYCVKMTALGAAEEGFTTWIVEDAIRGIDCSAHEIQKVKGECEGAGVKYIRSDGPEIKRVREMM